MPYLRFLWTSTSLTTPTKLLGIGALKVWLAQMTLIDKNISDREAFSSHFLMFSKRHRFNLTMAPFAKITRVPEWFTQKFLATTKQESESKKIWETFLTPKLLSTRLRTSRENVEIICFQPNFVSRQFEISQTVPRPIFNRKSKLCLWTIDFSEDEYLWRLVRHHTDCPLLTPFTFQPSFYCTPEFNTWWKPYHAKEILQH